MEEVKKPKVATKKRLEAFRAENNIDEAYILQVFKAMPESEEYDTTIEDIPFMILKEVFHNYDVVPEDKKDDIIKKAIHNLIFYRKFINFTKKEQFRRRNDARLREMLEDIKDKVFEGDVRASDYEQWDDELREYIKEFYKEWTTNYYQGEWAWGKVFYNFFNNWIYTYAGVPFHCYAYTTKTDILFTKQAHQFANGRYDFEGSSSYTGSGSKGSGCMVTLLLFIIFGLGMIFI